MQFTTAIALLLTAATGAIAAPGGHSAPAPPPPPPPPQNVGTNTNYQSNSCGNGASPYCCSASTDALGSSYWECSNISDTCNSITVCCNNNNQNNNQQGDHNSEDNNSGNQSCSAFGSQKVIYK
ncbi:hydrophobin [Trichoderma sp. SZMC 28014]